MNGAPEGRGRLYRICRTCGEKWNVSRIYPGDKRYVCPWCEYRARQAERRYWYAGKPESRKKG